jgi:folate-dependent phosphoribosylglycinamide formyltransferase PurN
MSGVVMLATDCDTTRMAYHALAQRPGVDAVLLEQPIGRGELLGRRVKRLGLRTVAGQVLFQGGIVPLLRMRSGRRVDQIKRAHGLNDAAIPEALIRRVPSANAPETIELLRALAPGVVVVNGTRILSRQLLAAVSAPLINTHAGITPLYRGVHGGYWALASGDREHCGVTVHLVNEGIDTGGILGQAHIEPTAADNFVTYPYLQIGAALPLLQRAVEDALAGRLSTREPPSGSSRLWSHPTAFEYLKHRVRAGVK